MLCSWGLLPSCHGSFPASSCVHSVHETHLPGFHRLPSVFKATQISSGLARLSGCHPWRFIQLQAVATYQTDVTRTSCCGLHLYYASSPRPAVSLSCRESCVNGSRLPAEQLRHIEESTK